MVQSTTHHVGKRDNVQSQVPTQRYGRRPFGVGLLVAGYDTKGPHIYETCPSANYYDCKAMAIGARSQSARTYLEKHLNEFAESSLEDLIKHGLRALRDTLPSEVELTTKNCSFSVVGENTKLTIYDDDAVTPYLTMIEGEERVSVSVAVGEEKAEVAMEESDGVSRATIPDPQVAPPMQAPMDEQ